MSAQSPKSNSVGRKFNYRNLVDGKPSTAITSCPQCKAQLAIEWYYSSYLDTYVVISCTTECEHEFTEHECYELLLDLAESVSEKRFGERWER